MAPPILVVGSTRGGGSAKTDIIAWLAARHPDFAILVHPTGYEDRLLSDAFPGRVFRHGDWLQAWREASRMGFLVAMADGGLQDPALDRCLAARISHPDPPRGYADLHPFGPYRQLDRDARPVELVLELGRDVSPGLDPSSLPAPGTRVSVACGIARPELFRSQLETAGLVVEELRAMPDHGRFPNRLVHRIRSAPADWIVTAKDLARHPEIGSAHVARRRLAFTPRAESRLDALASLLRARAGSP